MPRSAAASPNTERSSGLKRSVGRFQATGLTVGAMIGGGIFASLGPATEHAGSGLLLAMTLAGFVALCSGISGAQCGAAYPEAGGAFLWARKVGIETVGFIAGCCFIGKEIVGLGVIALTFGLYLQRFLPPVVPSIVAAAVVVAVTLLNYFGVQPTTKVIVGLSIIKVTLLLAFAGWALPAIEPAQLLPVTGQGPLGLAAGAALFFFTFEGFQRTAVIAGEIENPRRTLPFAIIVGFFISYIVFMLVGAATLGVLGAQTASGTTVPVFAAAESATGLWGSRMVAVAALMATLSVLIGGVLGTSRVALAMGKAHELPAWLSAIHPKRRVPHRAVLLVGLGVAALVLVFDLRPLLETANSFALVWFAVTNFDALRLPEDKRFAWRVVSWIGGIGCLAFLATLPWPALSAAGASLVVLLAMRQVAHRRARPRRAH